MSWLDLPFAEARRFLISKKVMTREQFDQLFYEERYRAFTVTGVNRMDVLQHVLDRLTDAVDRGDTLADFREGLDEVLSTAGLDEMQPWRAENIFRTGTQSAYGRGRWEQMNDPDLAEDVYGWRYLSVGDDRVRDEHAALDGRVFQTGEGDVFFPPWDFQCRCSSEIVLRSEAEELGLATAQQPIPPEAQEALLSSDFVSPAVSYDYTPDLSGYDPELSSAFLQEGRERFGG